MSSKLKKWILSIAIVLVVAVVALIGVTFLTRLSTSTIHDLRFYEVVDPETETRSEVFEKTVYLQSTEDDKFEVELVNNSSALVEFRVYSTNEEVATVLSEGRGIYTISYLSAGRADIVATTVSKSDISERFTLVVKNNLPTELRVQDEENPNFVSQNEVNIYADATEYAFALVALKGDIDANFNYSAISVVDNYDHDILESVSIDATNKQVVFVGKKSTRSESQIVTLQVHDESGTLVTSFNIIVNVKGYYINNMQLVLSQTPDFSKAVSVFGEGLLQEGEIRVNKVFFTSEVKIIYAKVRVNFTNGEIRDVSGESISGRVQNVEVVKNPDKFLERYFEIRVSAGNPSITFTLPESQEYESSFSREFQFNYITPETTEYQNFVNNDLYEYVEDEGDFAFYRYIYWDTRFQREDVIVREGKIVDFIGEPQACKRS